MTPDGHKDTAETLATEAGAMLAALRIAPGKPLPPRWQLGLEYARAVSALAGVHAQLAAVGDPR